ncbi:MAG: hypothetical protein GY953_29500, partial [bacterium]|nr:hypothetical protein [bacterium]
RFVRPLTPELAEIPEGTLRYLVWQAVEELDPVEFRAIGAMPGFQNALTALISELDAIGRLPDDPGAVSAIASKVWEAAATHGMAPRSARFRQVAERIAAEGLAGVEKVLIDGFFSLTPVELDLIRALASKASVTVTLPEWDGAGGTREQLLAMGFVEERRDRVRAIPSFEAFTAPTADKEAEEIARRILTEAAAGRQFREIGVVVRSQTPYVPILGRAFERFGIPARFYFGQSLSAHPVVSWVASVIESRLEGWDHEALVDALRLMPATPDLDRLQYRLLERLPGKGLEGIAPLRRLAGFPDGVRAAVTWAEAVAGLTALFPPPEITDCVTHEQASLWRSHAAAEQQFGEAMEETANALGAEHELSLREFWRDARIVLRATQLRPPDRRRNVVHVMDVYEARQWELPVVFVCGLVERQFPKHHTENALLGDAARRRLSRVGAKLPTSRDRDNEERFLFELATTRATERLVLSHPLHDSRGEETRRSFFLERFLEDTGAEVAETNTVRPSPGRPRPVERLPVLNQPDVLKRLAERHTT